MIADALIRGALDAGVELRIVDGQLKVSGRRDAVETWAPQLRPHKQELIRWFTRPAANEVEPPTDRGAWHELADAYHRHHFNCASCQAAGRGTRYGLRCAVGISLWIPYAQAAQ